MIRQQYTETALWQQGNGALLFHVFGLVSNRRGIVMAFAEARLNDAGDAGCEHNIVMRRSVDDGEHFSESVALIKGNGRCLANPVPLYDAVTERIWLFFAVNYDNKACDLNYIYSDDGGNNWSDEKRLNYLSGDSKLPIPPFCLPGPGHGIQLAYGKYKDRLILPIWYRSYGTDVEIHERGYCIAYLYSDDHGENWSQSHLYGQSVMANETRMTETTEALVWTIRPWTPPLSRWSMRSCDGGDSWSEITQCMLPDANICDAGILTFHVDGVEKVLLSRISGVENRENMEIRISLDHGETYQSRYALPSGNAYPGYSDMALLEDTNRIALLHCRDGMVLFSRIHKSLL